MSIVKGIVDQLKILPTSLEEPFVIHGLIHDFSNRLICPSVYSAQHLIQQYSSIHRCTYPVQLLSNLTSESEFDPTADPTADLTFRLDIYQRLVATFSELVSVCGYRF